MYTYLSKVRFVTTAGTLLPSAFEKKVALGLSLMFCPVSLLQVRSRPLWKWAEKMRSGEASLRTLLEKWLRKVGSRGMCPTPTRTVPGSFSGREARSVAFWVSWKRGDIDFGAL